MNLNEIRHALTGPVASVRVPFKSDGDIDYRGLQNAIEFDIAAGSPTILLTFGDSLYSVLSDAEVADVTKAVVQFTAKRAMVVAADRMWWTGQTIEFARYAKGVGADMLMTLPPDWGASCSAASFAEHYRIVGAEIPVMVVTAAFNGRSMAFSLEALQLTLQNAPGVLAVKDDICGEFARKLSLMVNDRWAFFSGGQKQNHLDVWPYGCDGYLSTFITFKPEIARAYWHAIDSQDINMAKRIVRDYDIPFFDFIAGLNGGFDAGMHGAMELFGIAERWRRAPYDNLTEDEMEKLAEFFKALPALN